MVKYPYVMALAGISCLYEMVLTILDYEMKVRRRSHTHPPIFTHTYKRNHNTRR